MASANLRYSSFVQNGISLCLSWVKSENGPKLENAVAVADYFDVSLDYLAGRTDVREVCLKKEPVPVISENGREMLEFYERLSERDQLLLLGRLQEMAAPLLSSGSKKACLTGRPLSTRILAAPVGGDPGK